MKTLAVRKDDLILRLSQRIGESIIMGFPLRSFIGNFYDTSIAKKRGEKKKEKKKERILSTIRVNFNRLHRSDRALFHRLAIYNRNLMTQYPVRAIGRNSTCYVHDLRNTNIHIAYIYFPAWNESAHFNFSKYRKRREIIHRIGIPFFFHRSGRNIKDKLESGISSNFAVTYITVRTLLIPNGSVLRQKQ